MLHCVGWPRGFLVHASQGDLRVTPHLVALIDAVDELRAGGVPGEADGGGIGGLSLHVARGHSGHCKDGGHAGSSSGSAGSPPSAQGPQASRSASSWGHAQCLLPVLIPGTPPPSS